MNESDRKRRVRRSVLLFTAIAVGIYVAFIFFAVTHH
jgi:hypothetical protein